MPNCCANTRKEGKTFGEVGARLRVPENTARMRVDRALGKLSAVLEARGVTSTAAALAAVLASQPAVAAPSGLAMAATSVALAGTTAGTGMKSGDARTGVRPPWF